MSKQKRRKPPAMPRWYWLGQDGCWFCRNKNACSNCSVIKKDRKAMFESKIKGVNSPNRKIRKDDFDE